MKPKFRAWYVLWSETDENEIIGNIYENKDILEVKE